MNSLDSIFEAQKTAQEDSGPASEQMRSPTAAHLEAVMAVAPVVLFELDQRGRFTHLQGKGLIALGLSAAEVMGVGINQVYPQHLFLLKAVERSLAGQSAQAVVELDDFVWELHCSPLWQGEQLAGVTGVLLDITQQQKTEAALRQTEAINWALIDAIPDLMLRVSRAGICLDYTLATRFLNLNDGLNWRGMHLTEFMPPDLAERRLHYIQQALNTGEVQVYEQTMVVGNVVQYEEVRISVCTPDQVLVIVQDVSDRKTAETALATSEAKFRHFVEQANDVIFSVNQEGIFSYLSPQSQEILGYEPVELIGQSFAPQVHPDDLPESFTVVERVLQKGERVTGHEFRARHKDGTWRWLVANDAPIRDVAGQIVGLQGIVRDITENKQKTAALEQTLLELRRTQAQLIQSEKMSSLGQLVAGVAHEINNPTNFIYGNLTHAMEYVTDLLNLIQVYQQCYPNPELIVKRLVDQIDLEFLIRDLPKTFQSMQAGTERIKNIVLSLRNFSRMDESEYKLVNIHEGIESSLMILEHRLKGQSHRSAIQVNKHYGDLPLVECYAAQLNQAFMQILANAIESFNPVESTTGCSQNSGSVSHSKTLSECPTSPTITITTEPTNSDSIEIRISDNGCGIPPEIHPRLFDPFFTTKPVGQGTGMGLSISYQVVCDRHQGTLQCQSDSSTGTTFIIQIPIRQALAQ